MKLWVILHFLFLQVTYQTELFLDKNKDYVVAEHQALLRASKCSFASSLFPKSVEESSKQSKFSSIGSSFKACCFCFLVYFAPLFIYAIRPRYMESSHVLLYTLQQQLQSLLETLNATEPHYIRCVKPNNLLKPSIFENHNVLQQLCCGVRKCVDFFPNWWRIYEWKICSHCFSFCREWWKQ